MGKRAKSSKENALENQIIKLMAVIFFVAALGMTQDFQISIFFGLIGMTAAIVFLLWRIKQRNKKLKRAGMDEIDQMEGIEFEKYLRLYFTDKGYTVKDTPISGDFGADLILDNNEEKIVVQAKRYSSRVGIKAVQESLSSLPYYKADKAVVITNSEFTKAAAELAEKTGVKLVGREELIKMMTGFHRGKKKKPFTDKEVRDEKRPSGEPLPEKAPALLCPRCGGEMVERNGKYGAFQGCSSFPACRYTAVAE
ncbi:restriction endonuclease [Alkalicoccus halolimnae]|uniref:Restriction endonuclease n=1 Tax=Alkalicoccus halolimnae TaxID=1667239 RepID=A0A5C7FL20_9BACI|nr:restriction endonuclease [Alkalicoccus halolimnae]TXF86779.1 hypothetical protein FTX54_02325 [Alkalicoccus halolimnae]